MFKNHVTALKKCNLTPPMNLMFDTPGFIMQLLIIFNNQIVLVAQLFN